MTVRTMHRPPLMVRSPGVQARPRNRWAPRVLGAVAVAMVPWVFVLGRTLPETTQVRHWPAVWIGLDLVMALGCATTACLYHRGDVRARLSASAVAALMVMDAWFDVLTARPGTEFTQALLCAVPELALVGVCACLALHSTERLS